MQIYLKFELESDVRIDVLYIAFVLIFCTRVETFKNYRNFSSYLKHHTKLISHNKNFLRSCKQILTFRKLVTPQ